MALAQLDDVKEFYGIIGTKPEDEGLLENLLDQVSAIFDTYCDRTFALTSYTEDYNGETDKIALDHYPIISITSITDIGSDWTGTDTVDSSYYKISRNKRYVLFTSGSTVTRYTENLRVVYTAGYDTIPNDLKLACIEETVRRFKRRQEVDVTGKTLEDGSTTFLAGNMLPQTKEVLNKYRNKGIA